MPEPTCPLCGAASRHELDAHDRNREVSDERFAYNRCVACGTVFLVNVPAELGPFYTNDYHRFTAEGEPDWKTEQTLLEVESTRVAMLRRHLDGGALIDIGAGPGAFVAAAQEGGYEVSAIEMDEQCCTFIEQHLRARAICSDEPIEALSALPQVNAITAWHALEHMREPAKLLGAAAERLLPGGVLALGLPNPQSLQFRVLRARWQHLDAPRHLTLMPVSALVEHCAQLGLRCVEVTASDPFSRLCGAHAWANALRSRPARQQPPRLVWALAGAIDRVLWPLERARLNGAAYTVLLQRAPGPQAAAG
ncbi:MAG: class I SAM-dependent methyltransferase [Solirubrobacteraceae bacterium]